MQKSKFSGRPLTGNVLKNETQKIILDFVIQTDHLISARRADLVKVNIKKRTCRILD